MSAVGRCIMGMCRLPAHPPGLSPHLAPGLNLRLPAKARESESPSKITAFIIQRTVTTLHLPFWLMRMRLPPLRYHHWAACMSPISSRSILLPKFSTAPISQQNIMSSTTAMATPPEPPPLMQERIWQAHLSPFWATQVHWQKPDTLSQAGTQRQMAADQVILRRKPSLLPVIPHCMPNGRPPLPTTAMATPAERPQLTPPFIYQAQ